MVTIKFFAGLRETLNCSELTLSLNEPQTISQIKQMIEQKLLGAEAVLSQKNVLCAVNQEMSSCQATIHAGDEVAFFPPVTGG